MFGPVKSYLHLVWSPCKIWLLCVIPYLRLLGGPKNWDRLACPPREHGWSSRNTLLPTPATVATVPDLVVLGTPRVEEHGWGAWLVS